MKHVLCPNRVMLFKQQIMAYMTVLARTWPPDVKGYDIQWDHMSHVR